MDIVIGSLESIPGLLKRLQIRAQATLASGISSLDSIPQLHNMKNGDEDDFFWIEAKKNEYIRTSTIEGRRKTNLFIPKLSKKRRQTKVFVPQPSKERRNTNTYVPQLSKGRGKTNLFVPKLSKERRKTKVFVPQPWKEQRKTNTFVPQLSKERRRTKVFVPQLLMI